MPIITRSTPLPPVPETPPAPQWPPYTPGARPRITISNSQDSIELVKDNGTSLRPGLVGLDMPPWALSSTTPGGWDGGVLDTVRVVERPIFIPLRLETKTPEELRALKRRLINIVNPKFGDTEIRVDHQDGTSRRIYGRFDQGMDTAWAWDAQVWQKIGLSFLAYDPFWQSIEGSSLKFSPAPPLGFLGDEFLPLTLSSDRTIGGVTVTNTGDSDTYPIWEIRGPGTDLLITNELTGFSFGLVDPLAEDEIITINTHPLEQTVEDQLGDDQWMRMIDDANLWPLKPGVNPINVSMGASSDESYVSVKWVTRHLTAM